jgi:hypothetical protein
MMGSVRRKIRLKEGNAKCRHLKNDLKRDFAAGVYLSESQNPIFRTYTLYTHIYSKFIHTGKGGEFNQRKGYRGSFIVPATRNSSDQQAVLANFVLNFC